MLELIWMYFFANQIEPDFKPKPQLLVSDVQRESRDDEES